MQHGKKGGKAGSGDSSLEFDNLMNKIVRDIIILILAVSLVEASGGDREEMGPWRV